MARTQEVAEKVGHSWAEVGTGSHHQELRSLRPDTAEEEWVLQVDEAAQGAVAPLVRLLVLLRGSSVSSFWLAYS